MSIIYSYPEQGVLNPNDMLIGTSAEVVGGKQKNITRNFSIQQIADYINDGGTVFNPAATDFQIAVFNQGGTKLTGSIISQNIFPNGTFVTIAGDLIANAATLNGAVAINGFLTLNGGATLGSGAAGELIAFASTTRLNAPIQDQLGRVGALDQILISDTAGRVSWQNYTSGLTYTGTWDALNNVTAPQGTPIVSSSGTNGEFYIVTLAGNTPLNGQPPAPTTPAYWQVGDWVVFVEDGGVGVWQKIDNSSAITGTGTDNKITMWTGGVTPSTSLTDSIMSQNTGNATITVTGALTTTGNVNAGGSVIATANVSGVDVTASGNVSAVNVTATTTVTPTTITDKDAGVGANGQILSSTVTGVEWIDNQVGTVTGTGTTSTLPIWSDGTAGVLGDSIMSYAGTVISVNGDFSTQGLEVNKYLTDGAGSSGTDGQVLTSTTVAADKEIVWTTPTVGTVTNFSTVSTAIPGITTAVTNSTTTPTLTLGITGTPTAALFLDGTGNWSSPGGGVTDITATAPLDADVATGSVTLSMPAYVTATGGYVPSGGATGQYLDGLSGSWTTLPAGDTYTLGSSTDGSNVKLNLDAASGTDSAITLTGAGGLTVAQTNNIVTLTAPAGSDTTYTLAAGAKSGSNVPLNLSPSTGSDTTVNLTDGTGITLTRNAANQVTISTTAAIGNFLPLTGGTMTGVISMGSDKITNVVDPTDPQDAATKQYVDDSVVGGLIYQGGYNASTNSPFLDSRGSQIAVSKGWTYTVTTDGTFYTETVKIGDVLIAEVDIAAGNGALTDWTTVQSNIDVASATVQGIANFPTGNNQLNIATGSVTAKTFGDGTSATSITGGYVPSASSAATGTFLSKTGSWVIPPNTGGTVTSVGLSTNVAALTVANTPVTGSDVLTLNRNGGTAGQYIDGASGAWLDLPAPGTGTVTGTGAATQVTFWDGTSNINGDTAFNWDNTNKRLGIGTPTPGYKLDVNGDARFGNGNNYNPLIQYAGSGRVAASPGYSFVGSLGTGMFIPNTANTLAFSTAATERMRITSGGNVGIGTTTPFTNLELRGDVAGSINTDIQTTTSAFVINGKIGQDQMSLQFGLGNGTLNYNNWIQSGYDNVGTGTTTGLLLNPIGGNVGIGTTTLSTTSAKLEVAGNANFVVSGHSDVIGTGTINLGVNTDDFWALRQASTSLGDLTFDRKYAGSWAEAFRIQRSTGNVGIGTTSPASTVLLDLKEPDAGSDLIIGLTAGTGARAQIRSLSQSNNTKAELSFYTVTGSSTSESIRITSTGQVKFNNYTAANSFTGTAVASLAVDSSGNIITEAAGGGASATITTRNALGDGTNLIFALGATPNGSSVNFVDAFIDGVYQEITTYSISGTNLVFLTGNAPAAGTNVETKTTSDYNLAAVVTTVSLGQSNTTGNVNLRIIPNYITSSITAQANNLYIFDSTTQAYTLTLPSSPQPGDSIKISIRGGLATNTLAVPATENIMGGILGDPMVINNATAAFEIIYSGDSAKQGWVIIGNV